MNKIIKFIFIQYDIGAWWGAFKSTWNNAAAYMSIFNTAMIVPMAYVTWVAPLLQPMGIAIPFWIFGMVLLVGVVVVLLLEYKLSIPSSQSFANKQFWKHDNPIRAEMNNIERRTMKKLGEQDERLRRIEEILTRIEQAK